MKILEGILFTNASWHSRINLPHGYIKRSQEANRLLSINCQSNWYLFFPQKKVSSTNCHYNKLLPYPSSIWTPQGFPLWNYRMEFPSKVTIWPNPPIKSKSPHQSPPNFLSSLSKFYSFPIFLSNGTLKSKLSGKTLSIIPELASFSCTFFSLNSTTELNMWLKSMAVSSLTFLNIFWR